MSSDGPYSLSCTTGPLKDAHEYRLLGRLQSVYTNIYDTVNSYVHNAKRLQHKLAKLRERVWKKLPPQPVKLSKPQPLVLRVSAMS